MIKRKKFNFYDNRPIVRLHFLKTESALFTLTFKICDWLCQKHASEKYVTGFIHKN